MADIKKLGMQKVIASAVEIVSKNTAGFGISIDLDGFDPADGVHPAEFLNYFLMIAQDPKLIGADIVDFNPALDQDRKTEEFGTALIKTLMK